MIQKWTDIPDATLVDMDQAWGEPLGYIVSWCRDYESDGEFRVTSVPISVDRIKSTFSFTNEEDAIMFRLRW